MPIIQRSPQRAVLWSVITVVAFLAVEGGIFRSGLYTSYLEPNSSTGEVEDNLYWFRHTPPPSGGQIAVIGDSRLAEGFSSKIANAEATNGISFWNLAIGGMSTRNWYYLLRDVDPDRNRFRAVVLGLESYHDDDSFDSPPDRIRDLSYSLGRLRVSDCWSFARSMKSPDHQQTALSGCLFKGLAFRADIHAFLLDPAGRLKNVQAQHESGLGWATGYTGIDRDLTGLSLDSIHKEIHFPPGLRDEGVKVSIRQTLTPDRPPDTGETTRYRQLWFGRIIDLYRGTKVRIIFIEMPRAPLPVPEGPTPPRFIQSITGMPNVTVVPADTFRKYERPELFGDGLHLNSTGRKQFSAELPHVVFHALGME